MAHRPQPLVFTFPTDTPHAGIPLANGNLAVLAWGDEKAFYLTLNRQDYWNRNARIVWGEKAHYREMLQRILAGVRDRKIPEFIRTEPETGPRPCRMPLGRMVLPTPTPPRKGRLDTADGIAWLNDEIPLFVDPTRPLLVIGKEWNVKDLELRPASGEEVEACWKKHGLSAPLFFEEKDLRGWTQSGVDRRTICVAVTSGQGRTVVTVVYGEDHADAIEAARKELSAAGRWEDLQAQAVLFQRDWWDRTPKVLLENSFLQARWDYAMFKVSGMCRPGTPPPTLQGPWVEDNALAPWQCDYHFNINYQMAHWPLLESNHPEQYEPMIRQMRTWLPRMREYARVFLGIEDGVMLPHAANDEGGLADENWKCQFDAGSAAWIALMLWDHYRYTGDKGVLEEITYPMLRGALRVYHAMVEATPGQKSFFAPSPEFTTPSAVWFENPSFHLAFIHKLASVLPKAAAVLGIEDPALSTMQRLTDLLPRASIVEGEIGVGKDQVLSEGHRHHSHLAGVYPCEIFDCRGKDYALIDHTFWKWSGLGMGQWTGWSFPWAAKLWVRLGEASAAGLCLDLAARFFMHKNYFGTHNALQKGCTSWYTLQPPYIMQLDITAGYASAVMDCLAWGVIPDLFGRVECEGLARPRYG